MSKVDLCQQCKSPTKEICVDLPHLCGQANSPCFGCAVGEYADYNHRYCPDAAVKPISKDEMYEPHDCANWRDAGPAPFTKQKTA